MEGEGKKGTGNSQTVSEMYGHILEREKRDSLFFDREGLSPFYREDVGFLFMKRGKSLPPHCKEDRHFLLFINKERHSHLCADSFS